MSSGNLLVMAPHPDDELLGAGAIMARAIEAGQRVGVVVITDGAASDRYVDPAALAARRREETQAGLTRMLGMCPPLLFLEQPDGRLASATVDLTDAGPLRAFTAMLNPDAILITDPADAHPDHKAAFGLATRLISGGIGRRLNVLPISQRVDEVFDPAGYEAVPVGELGEAKAAALACHCSQLDTTTGFALSPGVLAAFEATEYLRTAYDREDSGDDAISADHFDEMFDKSPDPWGYDDTPYERDRFRRTIAALDDRRYSSALELGCANGALTEQLATLCDRLLATDISASALTAARARVGGLPNVTLERHVLPGDTPAGPFDLIVASDMLYYLGLGGVVALMSELVAQGTDNCRMLIASYLGDTETRLTGEMSSETAIAHLPGWKRVHSERTDRLRIDVLDRA